MRELLQVLPSLFDPRGRCNRRGLLVAAGLLLALEAAFALAVWAFGMSFTGPIASLLKFAFCWLAIAACSKRLHDLDLRAWHLLWSILITIVWTLIVAVGMVFTIGMHALMPASPWYLVSVGLSMAPVVAAMLWLHFAKGKQGLNRFGPEPDGLGFSHPLMVRVDTAALPA